MHYTQYVLKLGHGTAWSSEVNDLICPQKDILFGVKIRPYVLKTI